MISKPKYATALFPWLSLRDRFLASGYREALPLSERLRCAASLGVLDGVELMFPNEVNAENAMQIRSILKDTNLALASLGIPISGEKIFAKGTFTSRDPLVRQMAVQRVKEGMDLCAELGGENVHFFLGQDGCDYSLEVDFEEAWKWIVECIQEIAAHRQDIKICLEYKPHEPRRHLFYSNVGTALNLMNQVSAKNLGVLFDTGHAMLAGENLGESIYLLQQAGKLFYVHFNDNYRNFDDDMVVGSVHFLPFVEAIYWLKRTVYTGWLSLDLFPYREDADITVRQSISFLQNIDNVINTIGLDEITALFHENDGAKSTQALYRMFIKG